MARGDLTAKQRAYAVARGSGMTPVEAFRHSYDASNMKPPTVSRKASDLENNGNVRALIESIQKKATTSAVVTLQEALEGNSILFREALEQKQRWHRSGKVEFCGRDTETAIAASKELSRLQGWDKRTLDVNMAGGVMCVPTTSPMTPEEWRETAKRMIDSEASE